MPTLVLVAYASMYGSTKEVAEVIVETLHKQKMKADLQPAREIRTLEGYDAVVLGAPLVMFHWHKDAKNFLARYHDKLTRLPVAVFALGPVQDPHNEKEWLDSKNQLTKELSKFPWFKSVAMELFGGRFDPKLLRWPINKLAGSAPASDIRNWKAIRAWAVNLAKKFK